jgi:deoxyribodipyrimidine photolyase-related protein
MMKLGLIFPHQLFESHPVLIQAKRVLLVSESLILGGDAEWPLVPHAKKLLLHKASMAAYSEKYKLEIIDDFFEIDLTRVEEIVICRLVDDVLEHRLRKYCEQNGIILTELETPGFVTPSNWGKDFFKGPKKPFMKTFYEAQRKRMGILVDDQMNPVGGRWSFDDENRKKFPTKEDPPEEPSVMQSEDEKEVIRKSAVSLTDQGVKVFGDYEDFIYPITHASAHRWLDEFLQKRFSLFGIYEDALTYRSKFLYHSLLTPMLNTGLLTPQEVVDRALEIGQKNKLDINSLEGFIRQVIGWREYMALMYERHGRYLRMQNFWKFTDSMPLAIYQYKTGIPIVDDVLSKVRKDGYAHHIERLMVLGNFFLLLRIKPNDVFRWFSEMFVDAYDWVMVPNVYGMSQFSDGGLLVTKPYLSGSNYLRKMSDYKEGEWCEIWDALFWSFIDDYRDFFSSQYRMKMMVSHLAKMGGEKLATYHQRAADFRKKLQQGGFLGDDLSLL